MNYDTTLTVGPDTGLTTPMGEKNSIWLSDYMLIGYVSFFTLLLHLIAIEGYGYFRDELYYISCSDHLALGYVDQPPLSIFFLKLIRWTLGDSLLAIRIFPAIGASLYVFGTGLLAKELGGKRFALILASITALAPIGNFFLYSIYSMNFLDQLFWLASIYIIVSIIKTGNSKLWLWFGVVAGLGLQNKISLLFLGFGLAVGIVLSRRQELKSLYLWSGAALAGLIFLPYILWNMFNDWPILEFMHNAGMEKMAAVSPLEFLKGQVLVHNPVTMLIWLIGLWFFFFNKEGKKYRLFGWLYVSIYVLFTIQQAKAYYLSPVYPILFAGGAVMIEQWIQRKSWNWLKPLIAVPLLSAALVFCPMGLAILSQEGSVQWMQTLGIKAESGENHRQGLLPQHFADMHGWPEMTEKVAQVYNTLTPAEQKECIIFAGNYGETGAINFFGQAYHLPPAFSGHNNHFFWKPEGYSGSVVISIGVGKKYLVRMFDTVTEVARIRHKYAMPYENNLPIYICRNLKIPLDQLWPKVKHFG